MEQRFKEVSKVGSYIFLAGISFLLYNILNLKLDTEYSLTHGPLLGIPVAHADIPTSGDSDSSISAGGGDSGSGDDSDGDCS